MVSSLAAIERTRFTTVTVQMAAGEPASLEVTVRVVLPGLTGTTLLLTMFTIRLGKAEACRVYCLLVALAGIQTILGGSMGASPMRIVKFGTLRESTGTA